MGYMKSNRKSMLSLAVLVAFLIVPTSQRPADAPVVDLGYQRHQGVYNATTDIYKFNSIRYAQPPVGDLRFKAPVAPKGKSSKVETGNFPAVCPGALPAWYLFIAIPYQNAWAAGNESSFNYPQAQAQLDAYLATNPALSSLPSTTEDCLFLDVYVPKPVFQEGNSRAKGRDGRPEWSDNGGGAPVVIWIYGGGYVNGNKDTLDPTGLIEAADDEIIYVALKYRIGAFGFSSGPTLEADGGMPMQDCMTSVSRFSGYMTTFTSLEEIQSRSQLWERVLEVTPGGSVLHQITAYGSSRPSSAPFQRAIPQSPGFYPAPSISQQEENSHDFLTLAGADSFAEARTLPAAVMIEANARQVFNARYSSFVYNPVVDGTSVPDIPSRLLLNDRRHAPDIELLVGHNAHDAPSFTPPNIANSDEDMRAWLKTTFTDASPSVLDFIIKDLYPPIYDGSQPYSTPLDRAFLLVGEIIFLCNTNHLNRAFDNETYAYEFQVPPAVHAQDVAYTFYNARTAASSIDKEVARAHQGYVANFIREGNPNGKGLVKFPEQGSKGSMMAEGTREQGGVRVERDPTVNARCAWWAEGRFA